MLRDLSDGDGRRAPGRKPSNYMSWRPRSSLVSGRHASRAVKRLGSPSRVLPHPTAAFYRETLSLVER
jgi:hypothetical protein